MPLLCKDFDFGPWLNHFGTRPCRCDQETQVHNSISSTIHHSLRTSTLSSSREPHPINFGSVTTMDRARPKMLANSSHDPTGWQT